MNSAEYTKYLRTPHWKRVRKRFYAVNSKRCFVCDEEKEELFIHHKHYRNIRHEQLDDLVCLCDKCHTLLHQDKNWNEDSHLVLRSFFLSHGKIELHKLIRKKRRKTAKETAREFTRTQLRDMKAFYWCPACKALPGEPCHGKQGRLRIPHKARMSVYKQNK